MTARDMIIDFINLLLFVFVVFFSITFITYKDNFRILQDIAISIMPLSFFIILFLIKSKMDRLELIRRKNHGDLDMILRLTFTDKVLLDIILFSSPVIIILISFLGGGPDFMDLLQASTAFLIFYFWQKHLFGKNSL